MIDTLLLVLVVVILTAVGLLLLGWYLDRRRTGSSPGKRSEKNKR